MLAKRICTGPSLIRMGSAAMILGVLWHRFVHAGPHLSEGLVDGVWGLFYGIVIGTWLLALRVQRRARDSRGNPPCAGVA